MKKKLSIGLVLLLLTIYFYLVYPLWGMGWK